MSESGVYEGGQLPIYQGNPATNEIFYGNNNETGQAEYGPAPAYYINYFNQETAAGRPVYEYGSPQYSQYLAEAPQREEARQRAAYLAASPAEQARIAREGVAYIERENARSANRGSDKGTFNIIAGIFAAVAVVLSGGTLLGVLGPAAAALEGGAVAAGVGGLEGAVAAGVAEGAIEAGAATAAVAEAAPAVAAVETGGVAAAGGAEAAAGGAAAGGAAETAAGSSVFSQIIDGATSVYNAVSGAVESVGNLVNISEPLTVAAKEAGVDPLLAKLGSTTLVGAGRGSLTSALTGSDPGLGALGGAVGGLVSAGAKELLGAAGLGKEGFEGGLKGTLSSALGGGASGAARAAASGGDVGAAALRGLATGGASGAANYLLSDALGLGSAAGSLGGSLASSFVGSALAPDTSTVSRGGPTVVRVPRPTTPGTTPTTPRTTTSPTTLSPTALGGLLTVADSGSPSGGGGGSGGSGFAAGGTNVGGGGTGSTGGGDTGFYGTSGAGGGGVTTSGTPTTISTSALASLLSSPSDPGYSSPLSDNTEPNSSQPSPWNRSSLRTTDPLGSSYG